MNGSPIPIGIDLTGLVTGAIREFSSYAQCKQVEKTERERIKAYLKVITTKLQEENSTLRAYLNNSFQERENLYKRTDEVMKMGLQQNDIELVKLAMNTMVDIYNKNVAEDSSHLKSDSSNEGMYLGERSVTR